MKNEQNNKKQKKTKLETKNKEIKKTQTNEVFVAQL